MKDPRPCYVAIEGLWPTICVDRLPLRMFPADDQRYRHLLYPSIISSNPRRLCHLQWSRIHILILPEVGAVLITGIIVSKIGNCVPFNDWRCLHRSVGHWSLDHNPLGNTTVQRAAYLVVSGLGIGLGLNSPYTALHVVLR